MIELDELKNAMDTTPDFEPVQLDLAQIMTAGGRVRRRRLAVGVLSGAAVVALLVGGAQLMTAGGTARNGTIDAAADPQPSGPQPSGPVPSAINSSAPGILGWVTKTGKFVDGRQWIIYVETVDPDRINENMTLVLGRTKTGYINDFTKDIVSYEPGGGRMAPGFHAVRAGTVLNGRTTPTFGYYAGEPDKITARNSQTGKTVSAHLEVWTGFAPTEQARVFWFDFVTGQPPATLTDLTAYDRSGKKMLR